MSRRGAATGLIALVLASALSVAPLPGVRHAVAAAGPIAEWKFDDGSGSTANDAIGNLDGALSGGPTWISGDVAQGTGALAFDGVDDLVTVANNAILEPTGVFSVALWFKSGIVQGLAPMIAKGHVDCGYGMTWGLVANNTQPYGVARLTTWGGWLAASATTVGHNWWDDTWHLLTMTVDPLSATSTATLDGQESSQDWPGPDSVNYAGSDLIDSLLRFGGVDDVCLSMFEGALDDIRIWNRALTHAEILAMLPTYPTNSDLFLCLESSCPEAPSITAAYVDQALLYRVHVTPWPALPGDITWYRSKDGGPEEVFATTPLRIEDMSGYQFYNQAAGSLSPGSYTIRAAWAGADNWQASSTPALPLEITKRPVTMEASLGPAAILPGEAPTLTARISVDNPPLTYVVAGSVSVYETTGGGNVLVGSGNLAYTGNPHWNTATIDIPSISAGSHTYEARFGGTSTIAAKTVSVGITAGPQSSWMGIGFTPNPVKNTEHATADITLGVVRKLSDPTGGLPSPTGTLSLATSPGGAVIGTTPVSGVGDYHIQLPILPSGSPAFTVTYSGDSNFDGYTTAPTTLTVVADTVEATGIGVQYPTFYPYKDGYRDTVAIKGTRLETAAVAISIYNPSGAKVRSASIAMGVGAWSWAWNGRNTAGTLLPAAKYRVVQVLTDGANIKKTVTSYTTLSSKRLVTKTVTITKSYTDAAKKTSTWLAWNFTLPSATVYKSLTFGIYGKDSAASGGFGPQDYSYCAPATYSIYCVTRWKTFPATFSWKSVTGSVVYDHSGRSVRLYAWGGYGNTKITSGRVTVTYGILK